MQSVLHRCNPMFFSLALTKELEQGKQIFSFKNDFFVLVWLLCV